jgi:hypothetical protein
MASDTGLRRLVYVATGLVIGVAVSFALVIVPRLVVHPQAIAERANLSYIVFFIIQLVAAAVLLIFIVRSRHGGRKLEGLLLLAGIAIILLGFIVFNGAVYMLQFYRGFYRVAILMLVCVGANLVAGILAIVSEKKLRHLTKAE